MTADKSMFDNFNKKMNNETDVVSSFYDIPEKEPKKTLKPKEEKPKGQGKAKRKEILENSERKEILAEIDSLSKSELLKMLADSREKKSVRFLVAIRPSEAQELEELTKELGVSRNEIIGLLIRNNKLKKNSN